MQLLRTNNFRQGLLVPALNLDFTQGVFSSVLSFSRASAGTYFDSAGVMQSAGVNVPRLDYDPVTLQAKGLLIEEQRTNLIPGSNEFVPSYNPNGAVATSNATTAPTGVIEATTISTTATSVFNFNKTGTGVVSGTSVAFSFFIKLVSAPGNISFNVYFGNNTSTAGSLQTFSFNSGVLSSPGSATIQNVGNSWYRVRFVQVLTADGNALGFTFGSIPASVTLALFGRQAEVGSFPTSYIPTTSAAVTRSADVCSMPVGSWYNQNEATMLCEFDRNVVVASNYQAMFAGLSGSSGFSIIYLETALATSNTHRLRVNVSGVQQVGLTSFSSAIANTTYRIVGAWKINDFACTHSLGTLQTANSGSIANMNTLHIGSTYSNSNYLNGHIRKVSIYRNRLPNSLLQSLTA